MNNHLERLIKQSVPFSSSILRAELSLVYLTSCITNAKQTEFKKYGVTLQQYNILRILRGQFPKPANISLLRDRMLDKMSDASRLVERLHKLGLVSKQVNDLDKRNADVVITDKALKLLNEVDRITGDSESVFDNLTLEELAQFNEILDKILSKF